MLRKILKALFNKDCHNVRHGTCQIYDTVKHAKCDGRINDQEYVLILGCLRDIENHLRTGWFKRMLCSIIEQRD